MIQENTSKNTINVVVELVSKVSPTKVLDIPCGSGSLTEKLNSRGIAVISSDIENMIKTNQENFIQSDMDKQLCFENESFDAVVSIDGIEHIRRQFDFIGECRRVLKRNGTLILSTPNITSIRSRWRYFLTGFHNKCKVPLDEKNPSPLHHISMISFPELRYILHTNGFRVTSIKSNRYKSISMLYIPLIPIILLVTFFVFKKELKSNSEKKIGTEIFSQIFNPSLMFGETTILTATKI